MARAGIIFGLALCGLTLLALVGTPVKTPIQFIPMMLGIPILFCGVVALNPHRRRYAMRVASLVALVGAIVGAGVAVYWSVGLPQPAMTDRNSLRLVIVLTSTCTLFVAFCVAFFISLRRRKRRAAATRGTLNLHPPPETRASTPNVNSRESA